ncbi:von Willebrand factor A domain-containing protein 5B2 isoform X1 [Nerophis ophidion]|uniref:von Willebrand factor A domain-containing protein 5B2 isoform X1 n=1 Tax=Nerophis ophidion TaxID=159077 RepID=UPI002AE0AB82|nr:von Willebrand factor A domain-containing protein 5B2 isoform X1 [Nerophis ophidion]XP_061776154.1 von Willebrand factor A domain-containing protein 5B2 isoform X1 [Nerophis ophidion]XP_061776155.1 von Willebrand factor A domain-containing protein 5B2 isoform X1 [Nerophis ophidion]
MVGLRNRSTWEPLVLKSSCIKSCAIGCSLGITAHLTYANADKEPVEGVFVYPLGEKEVVVGFEATIAGRQMGVQIQNRGKLKDCCLDCCPGSGPDGREWNCCGSSGLDMQCTNGHLILDEDLERTTFIVGTGVIGPMDIVSIIMKTSLELPTLENGAIRIVYPTILTPVVTHMTTSKSENGGKSEETGPTSCFGATSGKQDRVLDTQQQYCAHAIFTRPAANLAPYELNFQLLVRGACLLAGLESPTHALRADADPSAQSASITYITLAQEHPYDRHIEIILHLSEPHSPLVIIEKGRLSFAQYGKHIHSRRDFIRCTRKDPQPEKKVEFVRKRYHKDILNNPVLMLNFCPDLLEEPLELNKANRETLFLVDGSGSMSGDNMRRVKEAMVVALKSLPAGTLLNIVGFGTNVKSLFTASQLCTDVTLMQAYEYVQKMRADMRGTDLMGALSWVYQQPMQQAYPRQVFIITDGSISNVGKVLELVRRNTCAGRCFGLGLGPRACRRLLQGVAKLTGGTTEILEDGERLQPKLIKSLKKALEPVLTDVRIDWYLPENVEALLSPNEIPPLYPGNRLIGYCTLYDMTTFKAKCQGRAYKDTRNVSIGSVFCQSNDEMSPPTSELMPAAACSEGNDLEEALREISRDISSEFSCAKDADPTGWSSDVRTRIQETSYIQEQYVLTHCSLSSERSPPTHVQASSSSNTTSRACPPDPIDSAPLLDTGSLPQGLEKMPALEPRSSMSRWADSEWQENLSAESPHDSMKKSCAEEPHGRQKSLARSTMAARSFSSPQGEMEMHRLRRALERVSFDQTLGGRLDESDGESKPADVLSHRSLNDSSGLLFPASPLDWDNFTDPEYLFTAVSLEDPPPGQCRSLIHGLLGGRPVSWEVTVNLSHLWVPEDKSATGVASGGGSERESWEEIVHQLTARSVIRDFEKLAERENQTEHGSAKRYRVKAIQTSKHCSVTCMYTAFTILDSNPNRGFQESMEVQNTGTLVRSSRRSHSGSRKQKTYSVGLGRRPASGDCEEVEDTFNSTDRDDTPTSPQSLISWDSNVGGNAPSTAASATTGPSSTRSQRSIESKSMESFFGTRFPLGRLRSSISSGRQVPLKSHCLSAESEKQPDKEASDYLPLVRLQLASGAFLLTELYADCVQISLDRLKRASPYTLHRRSLSPPFRCPSPSAPSLSSAAKTPASHHVTFSPSSCSLVKTNAPPFHHTRDDIPLMLEPRLRRRHLSDRDPVPLSPDLPSSEEGSLELPSGNSPGLSHGQADSGRGSETDMCEGSSLELACLQVSSQLAQDDLEGSSWATAVALAWLEHRCAGYFMEWELLAAKADFWLRGQELPEGVDLAGLRGAARQLFLLLRHWDENIKFNMLCYNPKYM